MQTKEEKLAMYPSTEKFKVVDTISVPHPYCITPKHVIYAADKNNGLLDVPAIERAEKEGAVCDTCKRSGEGILPYAEHKQALVVQVTDERALKDIPELHTYLVEIKSRCEADGYVGFVFMRGA